MQIIEGKFYGKDKKFTLVVSRFNSFLTERLLEGAIDGLVRNEVDPENIRIVKIPGAFEMPLVCKKIADQKTCHAIIGLGAVIRGDTPHFDFVAAEVSKGLANMSLATGVPMIFGILTTDTIEQAEVRAGAKGTNKGFEAALTALELVSVLDKLS